MNEKVRVVSLLGGSEPIGYMDARPGMQTHLGSVVSTSGSIVSVSGVGTSANRDHYASHLLVTYAHATGTWSFPTGDGSVLLGRSVTWPSGVPRVAAEDDRSMLFWKGNGPHEFSR